MPDHAQPVVRALLTKDAAARPAIAQARQLPWFSEWRSKVFGERWARRGVRFRCRSADKRRSPATMEQKRPGRSGADARDQAPPAWSFPRVSPAALLLTGGHRSTGSLLMHEVEGGRARAIGATHLSAQMCGFIDTHTHRPETTQEEHHCKWWCRQAAALPPTLDESGGLLHTASTPVLR